jgi:hypothetical protein
MTWALTQLCSYSAVAWSIFVSTTLVAAYFGRGWGIVAAHVAVAFMILWLDVRWIRAEMDAPGWDGVPDIDIVFQIGILLRVVLINTVLMPIALASRWLSLRRAKEKLQPVA